MIQPAAETMVSLRGATRRYEMGDTTVVTGVVAFACTPPLLARRLMRMSIPDALRVME